jgi:hypothetical protein
MCTASVSLQVKVIIMLLTFIHDVTLLHAGLNVRSLIISIDISSNVGHLMTAFFILLLLSHKHYFVCVLTVSLLCFVSLAF